MRRRAGLSRDFAVALALVLGVALPARAAGPDNNLLRTGVRIDQLQPASPESAFFRAEGPHTPQGPGVEFAFAVTVDDGTDVLKEEGVDKAGNRTELATLVKNALLVHLAGSISPVHWVTIELEAPFAIDETGDKSVFYGGTHPTPVDAHGVGDPRLGVHFRPIDAQGLGIVVGGRVWAPVGTQGTYLSDGQFRGEIDVGVTGEAKKALWGVTASVSPGFFATRDGDRIALSPALYGKINNVVSLGVEPDFELLQDVTPTLTGMPITANSPTTKRIAAVFEPLGALRLRYGKLRGGIAAGPGFGAEGAAGLRILADVAIVVEAKPPPSPVAGPSDRDKDGIPDTEDACPDDAGPRNADPKLNGCPILDRDADGIPDNEDYCPDRPGIRHPNPKANGCPDTDNDGIPDPIDACPLEPGKEPDGCPRYAHLQRDGFRIDPPIEFKNDDKLTPQGRAAIEEIAATTHANKKIDQVSIGIGTKGARPALSDKRAQAILLVLRSAALESERYEVVLRDDLAAGKVVVRIVHP